MHRICLLLALAPLAAVPGSVIAQPATQASAALDGQAVATEVKRLLNTQYVLYELRPKFVALLDKGIASGRYQVTDRGLLISRINEDLHAVTPDKHLGLLDDPERFKAISESPIDAETDDREPTADELAAAARKNHGLVEMKILPGNIRYLEIQGFEWVGPATERAYDQAMAFLAAGDAVIIDLRRNGGGSPEAVQYAVSHFLAPNKPLMTFHMASRGTQKTASLATLRAPRMIGKPLYVLSSRGSGSAAEEFLGHIAGYRLGEVVGERSAGAGFRNEYFVLPSGLLISISVGRAVLESTGKDWEAVGISPTIETPVDKALDIAQAHALKRLAANAKPEERRAYEAQAALLLARANPVKTALPLTGYAGTYGERTVSVEGNGIVIQRQGGSRSKLVAIGPNVFTYENDPGSTLTFDVDGSRANAIHLVRGDGSTAEGKRAD